MAIAERSSEGSTARPAEQTVVNSIDRWCRARVWTRVLAELQRPADERRDLASCPASCRQDGGPRNQHAAGRPRWQQRASPGQSRGGFSTTCAATAMGDSASSTGPVARPCRICWQVKRPGRIIADRSTGMSAATCNDAAGPAAAQEPAAVRPAQPASLPGRLEPCRSMATRYGRARSGSSQAANYLVTFDIAAIMLSPQVEEHGLATFACNMPKMWK